MMPVGVGKDSEKPFDVLGPLLVAVQVKSTGPPAAAVGASVSPRPISAPAVIVVVSSSSLLAGRTSVCVPFEVGIVASTVIEPTDAAETCTICVTCSSDARAGTSQVMVWGPAPLVGVQLRRSPLVPTRVLPAGMLKSIVVASAGSKPLLSIKTR